jgi:hypothetical protein
MQIAIELPDELMKGLDVKAVAKEFLDYLTVKYAVKSDDSPSHHYLNDLLKDVPFIDSLANKDPLALQQEMRNEWR